MSSIIDNCYTSLLLFPSKSHLKPSPSPSSSRHFEETLALRLRSLLPIPGHSLQVPLPWVARAVHLLALTLASAAALVSDHSLRGPDPDDLVAHLDAGVILLDACNAASAEVARLERWLLPLRFVLRLLSDEESLTKERIRRAQKAIVEWESTPSCKIERSAGKTVRIMAPDEPPRGKASVVRRATYAVEAVSRLVTAATMGAIGKGEAALPHDIRVSSDWPWAEAYNEVAAKVSARIGTAPPSELEAVEASVRKLKAVICGEEDGDRMEMLGMAVAALERATEEMTDGLDRLTGSVNEAFDAAMGTRNAALSRLRSAASRHRKQLLHATRKHY